MPGPEAELLSKTATDTTLWVSIIAFVSYILRKVARGISSDSVAITQDNVQRNTITTLREELSRVEGVVNRLQIVVEAVKRREWFYQRVILEAQVELLVAEAEINSHIPCKNMGAVLTKLQRVRDKLKEAEDGDDTQKD